MLFRFLPGTVLAAVVGLIAPAFAQGPWQLPPAPEAGVEFLIPSVLARLPEVEEFSTVPPPAAAEELPTPAEEVPLGAVVDPIPEESADPWDVPTMWATWCKPWKGSVELGLNGTDGNSENFNLRFGIKAERKTDFNTTTLNVNHLNKSVAGRKTARSVISDIRTEWPLDSLAWSYFMHGYSEYDEFKPFDIRLVADTGVGYQFVKSDQRTVIGRLGGAVSREIGGVDDSYVPEFVVGMEWKLQVSERQKLSADVQYFPAVLNVGEYRMNTKASWEVIVDPDWGLSLKLSAINRFDSTPTGAKRDDLDYAALLLWNF